MATLAGFFGSGTHRVFTERDDGYFEASTHRSLEGILSHRRTFAYPMLLRAVAAVSPSYALLPFVQAGLFLAAGSFLAFALWRVGWSPWIALCAAGPLGASELLNPFARRVLTECVAGAAGVATIAALLLALGANRRRHWVGLAVVLFLSYQLRPTYVVLVPLVPALAAVLSWRRSFGAPAPSWWRIGLKASALSLVPFIAFCTLRLVVVGHFGLVSFGGYNIIGVTASMLSPRVVEELPTSLRPAARRMLQDRVERGLSPIQERRFGRKRARFNAWYDEYNQNILEATRRVVRPLVLERYREERQALLAERAALGSVAETSGSLSRRAAIHRRLEEMGSRRHYLRRETNRLFTELARAIIRARPDLYLGWVAHGYARGLEWTLERVRGVAWTLYPALAVLAVGLLTGLFSPTLRRAGLWRSLGGGLRRAEPLLWAAGLLYLAMLLLVVLVEPPIERYLLSSALLVPSALAAVTGECVLALGRAVSETRAARRQP